jgi:hypothetical protein
VKIPNGATFGEIVKESLGYFFSGEPLLRTGGAMVMVRKKG